MQTGQGQQIDVGMLDTHVAWLANQGMNYLARGKPSAARQPASEHRALPGVSDRGRPLVLSIGNDPTFKRFCETFSLTHLLEDERFATNAARVRNRQLVTDTLTPMMRQHPTAWWVDKLEALKIGCGPINKLSRSVRRSAGGGARRGGGDGARLGGGDEDDRQPGAFLGDPADLSPAAALLGEHTRGRCCANAEAG